MNTDAATVEQTVLFADVVDSTGLYEAVGDEQAQAALLRCMDLMEEITRACGGAVRKRIGDEVLCVFPAPEDAARAAARMHIQVAGGLGKGLFPRAMRLRIGFEHGGVIEQDGELFGSSVHTAARLAALAKAGQTLTSRETLERIAQAARPLHRPFDRVQLKGQTEEREVVELLWSQASTMLSSQLPEAVRPHGGIDAIELSIAGTTLRLDAARGSASIGRDDACDLPVAGSAVSRLHAKVTLERGTARFEDMSTNGSSVTRGDDAPAEVRRRGVTLAEQGVLRLGLACEEDEAALVRYACIERPTDG